VIEKALSQEEREVSHNALEASMSRLSKALFVQFSKLEHSTAGFVVHLSSLTRGT